jgi:hypothetical protein
MSNVIQFLAGMGADAAMARMTAVDYDAAIAMLDTDDASREALALRDHSMLNGLLNGRPIMMCVVAAPEESPQEESDGYSEESEDEKERTD